MSRLPTFKMHPFRLEKGALGLTPRYPELDEPLLFGMNIEIAAALRDLTEFDKEPFRRLMAGEEVQPLLMPWDYWEICEQHAPSFLADLPAPSGAVN